MLDPQGGYMRALHICEFTTIRVLKEVIALQCDMVTGLLHRGSAHTDILGYVLNQDYWSTNKQLEIKIKLARGKYDLLHVHTSTSNAKLLEFVREHSELPIVWDVHDTPNDAVDRSIPSAVITPSNGYHFDDRCTTIYSMVPKMLFPEIGSKKIDATVLVSHVDTAPHYRDYRELQLSGASKDVFIYPTANNPAMQEHYSNLMQVTPYTKMLSELPKFAFGYAGAANSRHEIDVCVTNKFWEYVAAGLPILTYNSKEMSELVESMWYGVKLESLSDAYDSIEDAGKNVADARFQFTMESQIPAIKKVYKEAMIW